MQFDPEKPLLILTIGHSNQPLEKFIACLKTNGVVLVVDVRTIPRSRHNPQFNQETLPQALQSVDIGYTHMKGLGGLRHPKKDSVNQGWHNASFRGFADYMLTPDFEENLQTLLSLAGQYNPLAIMCAEALPWRCHRSLIADALVSCGIPVEHIMNPTHRQPHTLTPWGRVKGNRLSYPPP